MTSEQREKLLSLHRASTAALEGAWCGNDPALYYAADDAFRDYLFSLEVTQ